MDYKPKTSIRIHHANASHNKAVLVHILAILPNPTDNRDTGKLVVYRSWSKHRRRWFWYVEPIWVLDIWNKPP